MKSIFTTAIVTLGLLLNMTACTSAVWSYNEDTSYTYQDTLIALYATPKGDQVFFLGKQYHYVFQTNGPRLQFLIEQKSTKGLTFDIKNGNYHIKLDHPDKIQASFAVSIDKSLASDKLIEWAKLHHFNETNSTYNNAYSLNGTRYMKSQKVNKRAEKLSTPIHINVREHQRGLNIVYKLSLTPIAVAGDTLFIAASPIILFSLIYMFKDYHG